MKADEGFIEFLRELLEPLGRVGTRRMFGGYGVYVDELFIAIVIDGRLYLKVDQETRGQFEAAGSAPFVYQGQDKPIQMSYWNAPEEALDSPEQMRPWARMAIAAALRKPAAKPKSRRSPPSASKSSSSPAR
jgi:DNA transformation protein